MHLLPLWRARVSGPGRSRFACSLTVFAASGEERNGVSTTNREKRKQAKRKARERSHGWKQAPTLSPGRRAAQFFGWGEERYQRFPGELLPTLLLGHKAALTDRRRAQIPNLYDELAAVGWAEESGQAFLRFGDVPPGERSGKYGPGGEIEKREEGVSVFPTRITAAGHSLLNLDNSLQYHLLFLISVGAPAYLLRGRVVGRGSAGEPLLRDVNYTEPLPSRSLVATKTPSEIVESWNTTRALYRKHRRERSTT